MLRASFVATRFRWSTNGRDARSDLPKDHHLPNSERRPRNAFRLRLQTKLAGITVLKTLKDNMAGKSPGTDEPQREPWEQIFLRKSSPLCGTVSSIDAVNELIASYEVSTVSKFSVWKTTTRGFGQTGRPFFANYLHKNIWVFLLESLTYRYIHS